LRKKIFVIDDEPDMLKIARDLLESDGYYVDTCDNPLEALKKIHHIPPELILLDIRLPDKDGLEVCKDLKRDPLTQHIPIIMVSVKSDESDVVVGLEVGADDYIVKPFRRRELLARVKRTLKRYELEPEERYLEVGPLKVDFKRYTLYVKSKEVKLTPKEFELLGFLMQRQGQVVTRGTISEKVWGIEYTGSTRTIDVHVDQIRKKLGSHAKYIHSLKGIGYRFEKQ